MPKAVALWLLKNTKLTMRQISQFCAIHPLELNALLKKDKLHPLSPIDTMQVTADEIQRCEKDVDADLALCTLIDTECLSLSNRKKSSKKPLEPNTEKAVIWMVVNHPDVDDASVASLLKLGKKDVQKIRTMVTSKAVQIEPENPVTLKLCQQAALDRRIEKARANKK